MDVRLIMFKENGEQKVFSIDQEQTVIGRQEDCDLRIPLAEISRKHSILIFNGKTVTIRDNGSANGTYVNNTRIAEQDLNAGDHVVVGPVVFTVQINGEPPDVKPVKTQLESRAPAAAGSSFGGALDPEGSDIMANLFSDDDSSDPISELEAMTGSETGSAPSITPNDSFFDLDDSKY